MTTLKKTVGQTTHNNAVKDTRKKYFDAAEQNGNLCVDLGTTWKIPNLDDLPKSVLFVIGWLTRDENKGKMFNRADLTKNFAKEARELGLIKGGKIKSGAIIDKGIMARAVKYIYFVDKRFFELRVNSEFDFTVKEHDYIPNLIAEKIIVKK